MEQLKTSLHAITAFQSNLNNNNTNTTNNNNNTINNTHTSTKDNKTNNNPNNKQKKSQVYGYIHAIVMLFCFAILLGTTYTEQQPYIYSNSHQALMLAIQNQLALSVSTVDDVWNWIETVVGGIGGDGIDSVNANCQYYPYNSQEVSIDGVTYTLGNPSFDTSSCDSSNINFVTGSQYEVYLTGNHQLLSFGIFALRSVPRYPIKNSVKNAHESFIKVRGSSVEPLNPLKDDKIVEICDANWGKCLHKDGYNGEAGSTFSWNGRIVDGYYTFEEGSTASMILTPANTEPVDVKPCFIYGTASPTPLPTQMPTNSGSSNNGGSSSSGSSPPTSSGSGSGSGSSPGIRKLQNNSPNMTTLSNTDNSNDSVIYVALPGDDKFTGNVTNVTLSDCTYKWVSSGYDLRVACLDQHNQQPTALLGYLARQAGLDDVNLLMDSYFGCNSLFTATSDSMKSLYVTANKCLESNILGDLAYGVFFSSQNQDLWIRNSVEGLLQLKAHNYIDDNTRVVRVYFITRSLGSEQLFYSIITVEFQLSVDGSISTSVTATYVPMIMFQYGYDGYEWRTKDVYRFEVMLLIIFALFTTREIYQLITIRLIKLIPDSIKNKFRKKQIKEKKEKEKETKSIPVTFTRKQRSAIIPVSRSLSIEGGNSTEAGGRSRGEILTQNNSNPSSPSKLPQYQPIKEIDESKFSDSKDKKGRGEIVLVDLNNSNHSLAHEQHNNNNNINSNSNDSSYNRSTVSSINQIHPQPNSQTNLDYQQDISKNKSDNLIIKKPSELIVSDKNDVEQLVDDVNEAIEDLEDAIEDLEDAIEDILEDYTPDSAGVHDMLDWATIAVITIGIIYRVNYIKSAAHLHTYLMNLESDHTYDQYLEEIVSKFADIQNQERVIHLISIAVIAVGMLQFFRYLSFNKRFGIVTTTIAASTGDLLPVLVIFVSIVIAYAILASEIYGIQLSEYSTVQTSLAALFIMLLGNFDYYAMQDVSPVETAIFFWSFVVVILFILLNMVLAVIFTVYEEKNKEIREKEEENQKAIEIATAATKR